MSKRDLNAEDEAIWRHVARTVNSYKPVPVAPAKAWPKTIGSRGAAGGGFSQTRSSQNIAPVYRPSPLPDPQIEASKRVRRGKIQIDRKLDLHDMTQDQAYGALIGSLNSAVNRGYKCVLVVTGKGSLSQMEYGGGVLRRRLPHWLSSAQLRPLIASYAPAHIKHGGGGAWYVFLKSSR